MALIPFQVSQDIVTGDTLVEWKNAQFGDDFQPVPCRGYKLMTVQQSAAADQQSAFEGSIQATPEDFAAISSTTGGAVIDELTGRNGYYAAIRPKIVSGTPTDQNFAALFRRMV